MLVTKRGIGLISASESFKFGIEEMPLYWQKQLPEVFYEKSCSLKFRNIHMKTPVLESLFNKVAIKRL